jgi:hypothetical protein
MDRAFGSNNGHPSTVTPQVLPLDAANGVAILDPIEGSRFEIYTNPTADLTDAAPSRFHFPVDTAVQIDANEFTVPVTANFLVRDETGQLITDCADREVVNLPKNEYHIELTGAPMKLYVAVDSAVRLIEENDAVVIDAQQSPCYLGVRSFHEKPAGTIDVPDTPSGLMDGVSLLGSALKTLSPERSFPTLRGHPPLLNPASEFSKPSGISRPNTDVQIVVPTERQYIYGAASLAYYLGAELIPGKHPRIITSGEEFELSRSRFHQDVNETLEQLLFFDCVARTEGYYQVNLYERNQLESSLELDYAALYDQPLSERTAAFLGVDRAKISDYIPEWDLTADIDPTYTNVQALPFLVNNLSFIRVAGDNQDEPEAGEAPDDISDLLRTTSDDQEGTEQAGHEPGIFTPEETESVEHVHIGDGYPLGSSKATIETFYRRLDQPELPDDAIRVQVVCNDEQMRAEDAVESIYGDRELLDFDISVHYNLTCSELRAVLSSTTDFLHYIGHVDDAGIRCTDGVLDVQDVDEVRVDAFLLNACRSYSQGMELINSGGLGGIVTLGDISNTPAIAVGRTLARLLNQGFPLRAALLVAKENSLSGYQYLVVGDGRLQLAQCIYGLPWTVDVEDIRADQYELFVRTYAVKGYGVGSLMSPGFDTGGERYLRPGTSKRFSLDEAELLDLLDEGNHPVQYDGSLYWSSDIVSGSSVQLWSQD